MDKTFFPNNNGNADEYTYGIPHPYTTLVPQGKRYQVPKDKQHVSGSASQSYTAAATTL